MAPLVALGLLWMADQAFAFFFWGSYCKECGAARSSRNIFWIPIHRVQETKLSSFLESIDYNQGHRHEWLFSGGGGGGVLCAIGEGRHLREVVAEADTITFLAKAWRFLPPEEFRAALRRILSNPWPVETKILIATATSQQNFLTAFAEWKDYISLLEEPGTSSDGKDRHEKEASDDDILWRPLSLASSVDPDWPKIPQMSHERR